MKDANLKAKIKIWVMSRIIRAQNENSALGGVLKEGKRGKKLWLTDMMR